ncbi:MAG: protein kinase [Endozoicomonadaceae bacterium]|nr:protein kinase [Endozoicomonadaceae bacterium]
MNTIMSRTDKTKGTVELRSHSQTPWIIKTFIELVKNIRIPLLQGSLKKHLPKQFIQIQHDHGKAEMLLNAQKLFDKVEKLFNEKPEFVEHPDTRNCSSSGDENKVLYDSSSNISELDESVSQRLDNPDLLREQAYKALLKSADLKVGNIQEKGKFLGSGSFGSVLQTVSQSGGAMVVKKIQRAGRIAQREIDIIHKIPPHQNVAISLPVKSQNSKLTQDKDIQHDSIQDKNTITTFTQYGGESLDKLVYTPDQKPLSGKLIKGFIQKILMGLDHLHRHKIVHADIKPENILTKPDGRVVIIDFGLAKTIDNLPNVGGSPTYMAPESLVSHGKALLESSNKYADQQITEKTDIYGLGMTLTELLTGETFITGNIKAKTLKMKIKKLVFEGKKLINKLKIVIQYKDLKIRSAIRALKEKILGKDFTTKTKSVPSLFDVKCARNYRFISSPENQQQFREFRATAIEEIYTGGILTKEETKYLIDMLDRMTDADPAKRPTAKEVLESLQAHHFIL